MTADGALRSSVLGILNMSMFVAHQDSKYTLLLADSLARKRLSSSSDTISTQVSKLVSVGKGVFAAHAGTWQPAMAMLSDLATLLMTPRGRPLSHKNLISALTTIGRKRFAAFQSTWSGVDIDVRVALVITGALRDPTDKQASRSSTILLWEAARDFKPVRTPGTLCFAGSPALSLLTSDLLAHETLRELLQSSPLMAAQALLAAHAAAAKLSDSISEEPNLLLIGSDQRSSTLRGSLLSLPNESLLLG